MNHANEKPDNDVPRWTCDLPKRSAESIGTSVPADGQMACIDDVGRLSALIVRKSALTGLMPCP